MTYIPPDTFFILCATTFIPHTSSNWNTRVITLPTLGDELPVNERQLVFGRNGSLVLKKILPSDAGTYTCTVTAPEVSADDKHPPPRASQDISISVMGKLLLR